MSVVTMLGVKATPETLRTIKDSLRGFRLVPTAIAALDPLGSAARAFADRFDLDMSWWIGVEGGAVDLDRVYDISTEIREQRFEPLCLGLTACSGVERFAFLFFDLGSGEVHYERLGTVRAVFQWVQERVAEGAPVGSLVAWVDL